MWENNSEELMNENEHTTEKLPLDQRPNEVADELTPEELAEIKRRRHSPGPWLSTDELVARIESTSHGRSP